MATIVFSDEIVNPTQLRARQSHWLAMASRRPVTVTYGSSSLTILSREKIRNLYTQIHHLELFMKYYNEKIHGEKSTVFPWVEYLDDEEKAQFHDEYFDNIMAAIVTGHWDEVEILLEDWKATAETESNPELVKALKAKVPKEEYVAIK